MSIILRNPAAKKDQKLAREKKWTDEQLRLYRLRMAERALLGLIHETRGRKPSTAMTPRFVELQQRFGDFVYERNVIELGVINGVERDCLVEGASVEVAELGLDGRTSGPRGLRRIARNGAPPSKGRDGDDGNEVMRTLKQVRELEPYIMMVKSGFHPEEEDQLAALYDAVPVMERLGISMDPDCMKVGLFCAQTTIDRSKATAQVNEKARQARCKK